MACASFFRSLSEPRSIVIVSSFFYDLFAQSTSPARPALILHILQTHNPDMTETQVNSKAAEWNAWLTIAASGTNFFAVAVLAAISDRLGRKAGLAYHFVLDILSYVGFVVVAYFVFPVEWLFLPYVLDGISSLGPGFIMVTNAYLSDISEGKSVSKAKSFGYFAAVKSLGGFVGPYLGGWMFENVNPYSPYVLVAFGHTLIAAFLLLVLPESLKPENRSKKINLNSFNIFISLAALVRNRSFFILAVIYCIENVLEFGARDLILYYTSLVFSWDPEFLGLYVSVSNLIKGVLTAAIFPFAYWILPPTAWILMQIIRSSLFSFVVAFVLYGFATDGWMFFVIVVVWGCGAAFPPAARTVYSNGVAANEQGKILGAIVAVKKLSSITFKPGLELIYSNTVHTYPALPFYIMSGLSGIALALTLWLKRAHFELKMVKGDAKEESRLLDVDALQYVNKESVR